MTWTTASLCLKRFQRGEQSESLSERNNSSPGSIRLSLQMSVGVWLTCNYKLDIIMSSVGREEGVWEWPNISVECESTTVCPCTVRVKDTEDHIFSLSRSVSKAFCAWSHGCYKSNRCSGTAVQFLVIPQRSPLCVSSDVRLFPYEYITLKVGGDMISEVDGSFCWIS